MYSVSLDYGWAPDQYQQAPGYLAVWSWRNLAAVYGQVRLRDHYWGFLVIDVCNALNDENQTVMFWQSVTSVPVDKILLSIFIVTDPPCLSAMHGIHITSSTVSR